MNPSKQLQSREPGLGQIWGASQEYPRESCRCEPAGLAKEGDPVRSAHHQRVYSWDYAECELLWKDIIRAGASDTIGAPFTGSIVYVEKDQGNIAQAEPALIIDGQQRITAVTLLLAPLAAHLDGLPEGEREPVTGFAPQKIRGLWLTNEYEDGDKYFKLILSQAESVSTPGQYVQHDKGGDG